MKLSTEAVSHLLRHRKSVFPKQYIDKEITKEVLLEILEDANWAPTHRMTEPWRFKIFKGESRNTLSAYLGDYYKTNTPDADFSDFKYKKTLKKPLQSACVIAICMQRDPKESVPEWEEVAAVSCAVQNMYLSCTAHGIGCYWSSPKSMRDANEFLGLKTGESCLGLLYMGYYEPFDAERKRGSIADKVEWK